MPQLGFKARSDILAGFPVCGGGEPWLTAAVFKHGATTREAALCTSGAEGGQPG